jgi:hypothetical protein
VPEGVHDAVMQEPAAIPDDALPLAPTDGADAGSRGASSTATDRVVQLVVAIVSLGASVVIALLDDDGEASSDELRRLTSAGTGFLIEGIRAVGVVLGAVERVAAAPAAAAERAPLIGHLLAHWRASWERTRDGDRQGDADTLQRSVDALLGHLDLTGLIRSHVDVQQVVSDLDVNALVADLDVERLASGIDVDALASRIDVDALAQRLDLEAVLERVDVVAIATDVIEQLDLPELIRDATQDTTSDGVRSVRLHGVDADRAVRRAVDRILARRNGAESA